MYDATQHDIRQRFASSHNQARGAIDEEGEYSAWIGGMPLAQRQHGKKIPKQQSVYSRSKPGLAMAICVLAVSPLLNGLLPAWALKAVVLAGMGVLAIKLLTFRRWNDEIPYARKFFIAFVLLLVELGVENFFTWCTLHRAVSASDMRKYERQQPLQDNVEVAISMLAGVMPTVTHVLARPWVCPPDLGASPTSYRALYTMEILQLLIALILLGVSVLFDQVAFSGFGMMTRAIHTITFTRIIRTAAFMCTVLPSQRPGCFQRRFPPVPQSWSRFFIIGFTKMRAMGGCNDLVISGHAIVYMVAPLAFQTYYGTGTASTVLWAGVAYSCIRAPFTKQHYSVDMFLAVVVTALVWHWAGWAYDNRPWRQRHKGEAEDPKQWIFTALILAVLALLSFIVIVGGA